MASLHTRFTFPCGVTVPNRIIKGAMTECLADASTNSPNKGLVQLYKTWGESKAAILLSGNIMVDRRFLESPCNVAVEDDRDLSILQEWAREAQKHGSQLWAQISHPGRQCPISVTYKPVAPSNIKAVKLAIPAFATPRALTGEEIQELIIRFAKTALVLKKAGFSGVQIHGAHGYLISQFLSPLSNLRTDDYGGTPEKRRRFLLDVVRAVRKAVGDEYPVSVKLNSADFLKGGFTEEESMQVVKMLEDERIDLLEISGGTYENPQMMSAKRDSTLLREAFFLEYAKKVRKLVSLPLMLTGGVRTRKTMEEILLRSDVDFIGIARPFALEPHLIPGLLDGSTEQFKDAVISTGVTLLDNGLQNLWHGEQIRRMARGLAPDPNMGVMYSLTVPFVTSYLWHPGRSTVQGKLVLSLLFVLFAWLVVKMFGIV